MFFFYLTLPTAPRKIADCPLDLEIPADYSLSHYGIMRLVPKKGGKDYSEIPVSRTPLIVTKRFAAQNSSGIEYELAFKTPYVPDHWIRKTVDATTIADSKKIVSLSELGISVSNAKLLTAYLDEFINSPINAQKIKSVKIFNRSGWNGDTFIYPTTSAEEDYIVRRAGIDSAYPYSIIRRKVLCSEVGIRLKKINSCRIL